MGTHYNFKVNFHQLYNNEIKTLNFYETLNDISKKDLVEIEENRLITIQFNCENKDAKLYLDFLDEFPLDSFSEDSIGISKDEIYIKPCKEEFPLYYNEGVCPFIPGIYEIRVKVEGKIYYSLFNVIGKNLTFDESNELKRELESEIDGISFEFVKRKFSFIDEELLKELPKELYAFLIIEKDFSNIMNSLMELKVRPNYKISNSYRVINEEKVRKIDNITMRSYLNNSIKPGFMKAPIKNIEYDLPENRWIKKIVCEMMTILNRFSRGVGEVEKEKLSNFSGNEEDLKSKLNEDRSLKLLKGIKELRIKADRMRSSINILKSTDWYNSVGKVFGHSIPHVLIQDSRYNILYRVYEKLHSEELKKEKENINFSLQWKRTDNLYEMWCYIKICKILRDELKYENIQGDIYTKEKNKILQSLNKNTVVTFKKEEITLKFYYDSPIPRKSSETDFDEKPIFIKALNNRPDGRLDIYKNEIFLGSIIFEFKYRYREDIWKEDWYSSLDKGIVKQLMAYGTSCDSIFTLKKNGDLIKEKTPFNSLQKVIVLYPKSKYDEFNLDEDEDNNLKFIKLKPKSNLEIFTLELKNEIEKVLKKERFYGI